MRDTHSAWWCARLEGLGVTGPTDDVIALVDANHDDLVAALVVGSRSGHRARSAAAVAAGPSVHGNGTGRRRHAGVRHAPDTSRRAATSRAVATSCRVRGDPRARISWPAGLRRAVRRVARRGQSNWMTTTAERCRGGCWGCRSSTDRELLRRGREHDEPFAVALAAVRLALDAPLDEPESAREAMLEADAVAASYHSRYIADYARAAHGMQELVFGDLAAVIAAGYELVDSATRPMQEHGYRLLLIGGLLSRDQAAVAAAMEAARRAVARQVPGCRSARRGLGPLPRPPARRAGRSERPPLLCARRSMVGSTRRRRSRRPGGSQDDGRLPSRRRCNEAGHGPRHHRSPRRE